MRNFFQPFLIAAGLILSILIFHGAADACSCRPPGAVDKKFAKSPNVAVLKLQSVEQPDGEAANFFLSVEKIFKGDLKIGETLAFKFSSDCSLSFSEDEIGTEFLIYQGARPAEGTAWLTGRCSGSGAVKDKTADLSYLENEKKLRGKTRLSGRLGKWLETDDGPEGTSLVPLVKRKVRISGKGKNIELVTDENGVYETYDLPAGKYKITPEKLDGFSASSENVKYKEVEIKAKSHTEQDFYFHIDNEISGKVVDQNGKPLENACVDLVSLKTEEALGESEQSCTGADGKFEFGSIPVGTYRIVVNLEGKITLEQPFDTFYYPNVKNKEQAAAISVEANYFLKNLVLVPPEMAETVTLSGTLFFADARPAADMTIQFLKADEVAASVDQVYVSDFEVKTDKNGIFSLRIPKGQAGVLRGETASSIGEYVNCPAVDEILKAKGDKIQQLKTADLNIDATENLNGIELKFPFPSCKKATTEQ